MTDWACFWAIYEFIKEWQTLITGMLALAAAFATIRVIRHQIALQTKQFADIQERDRWAARARIPGALSEICSYTSSAAANIILENGVCPNAPNEAVNVLIDSMVDQEKNATTRIALLVEHFQVYTARLSEHLNPGSTELIGDPQKMSMLYDTAILQAFTNSLFKYGRRESETGPMDDLTRGEAQSGLTNAIGLENIVWENSVYLGTVEIINRNHSKQSEDK